MSIIENWKNTPPDTIKINWDKVEEKLGFALHKNLKDLYSRIAINDDDFEGFYSIMCFQPNEFVKKYINKDNWLEEANGNRKYCELTLEPLLKVDDKYICNYFQEVFFGDWTGGNDFEHRAYLGELLTNIGQITLIFNNDTGEFEWVDFGYGYYEEYEQNPYGIVADDTQEFLDKFVIVEEEIVE